jgi:hypothetical protein
MRKNVIRIALDAMLFALCLPAADAQQPAKVAKIGYLSPGFAKTLGLTIPPVVMMRAEKVIK